LFVRSVSTYATIFLKKEAGNRLGAYLWDPLEKDDTERIVQEAITSAKPTISVLGVGIAAILEKVVPALERTVTAGRAIQNDGTW
jgi:hypothetical protein